MNSVSMLNSGLRLLSLACLALAVTSCGADANDPKGSFGPHTPSTVVVFKGTSMNGSVPDLTATRNETVTVNGRTFTKLKVTPAGASSEAFSVFAN
ncbi:MAG TPA: hypothetical protein PLJ73_07225, partial [Myxococcota bacterium]|nr:hypothetical protein [Myxococcota bacterium]